MARGRAEEVVRAMEGRAVAGLARPASCWLMTTQFRPSSSALSVCRRFAGWRVGVEALLKDVDGL